MNLKDACRIDQVADFLVAMLGEREKLCAAKVVITINFNRNQVKRLAAELGQKADETSTAIDKRLVESNRHMGGDIVDTNVCFEQIDKFSLRFRYYAFIDTRDYLADGIFLQHKVRVGFWKESAKVDSPYVLILCKVRKSDEGAFLAAMEDLPRKMLLCGHTDYLTFCGETWDLLRRPREERRASHGGVRTAEEAE